MHSTDTYKYAPTADSTNMKQLLTVIQIVTILTHFFSKLHLAREQADVIDLHFKQLLEYVETSGDFEAVLERHEANLETLTNLIIGGRNVVYRTFQDIFSVCLAFCALISR